MNKEALLQRLDQIIMLGQNAYDSKYNNGGYEWVKPELKQEFRSSGLSFLNMVLGDTHPHYEEFNQKSRANSSVCVTGSIAILKAFRGEIEGGWFQSFRGILSAEIFSDFIEMSEHLLEERYKEPAAVLIGCVLEEHIRQLCIREKISIENKSSSKTTYKKADTMNADLRKKGIYNQLDQKQITAWLDLRNKAAHGKTKEFTIEQVFIMKDGVMNFLSRISI